MSEPPVITDAEAAGIDVPALLREGIADERGALRGELQGIGAVAAAVQLEREDANAEDVALALSQLRSESMGIEITPAVLTPRLEAIVAAGREASPSEAERELFVEWLGLVTTLLMMRARFGGGG